VTTLPDATDATDATTDLFEVMSTCRAMRYLKPDPVPPELIERVIWAATRAPSPANTQAWDFVVVDDRAPLQIIGTAMRDAMHARVAAMERPDRTTRLMLDGTLHLLDTFAAAPVVVFVCGPVVYPAGRPDERFTWSALYPAAQNLLLAARALGLGTTFTTLHAVAEPTVRDMLAIPDEVRIACTIPMGWPAARFGPVQRRPVNEVIHRNRW
jgi:nitroreductase